MTAWWSWPWAGFSQEQDKTLTFQSQIVIRIFLLASYMH
jgi:hypothetical protein